MLPCTKRETADDPTGMVMPGIRMLTGNANPGATLSKQLLTLFALAYKLA